MQRSGYGSSFGARQRQKKAQALLVISFLVCVLFGTVSAMVLFSKGDSGPVEVYREASIDTIHVLVPTKPIEPGTQLVAADFKFEPYPKAGLSPRAVTSLEKLKGLYARSMIVPNQPLVEDVTTTVKPNNAMTVEIPPGFRAVTIRVDARTSVEGFARPGTYVDVVWSTIIRGKSAVNTIVQNARILSAGGQKANKTDQNQQQQEGGVPGTVTLLVSADDANKIQLASTAGSLSMSLKGDRPDTTPLKNLRPITTDQLLPESRDTNEAEYTGPRISVRGPDGRNINYVMKGRKMVPAPQEAEPTEPALAAVP